MFKTLITGIIIVASFATLLSLGAWQINRLEWKTNILNDIAAQEATDITVTALDIKSKHPDFTRGYIDGTLNVDAMIKICPRTYDAVVGCHVYTHLKTNDADNILINLGWIENETSITYNDLLPVRFGGYLRTPDGKGTFTPSNRPNDDLWYFANINDMATHFGIDGAIHPQILYLESPYGLGNIAPLNQSLKPRNKHFQYAVFWFGMTALLAVLLMASWVRARRAQ